MFLLCFKIFLARIIDVSLGTVRTMFIVKGNKYKSCLIAFFELLIWFYAAKEALNTNSNSILIAISYSLGYTTGTLIGISLNDLLINNTYNIEVIITNLKYKDILKLKEQYYFTYYKDLDNKIILNIKTSKNKIKECLKIIKKIDSKSFITINEIKQI